MKMDYSLTVKRSLVFAGALLLFHSCVEPFQLEIPANDTKILVVEGHITDETGPFMVKLSASLKVNSLQLYGEPVSGADVHITDNEGNLFQLEDTGNGLYMNDDINLKGKVGNTYMLTIATADGEMYESTPVLMESAPKIDSFYYEEGQVNFIENQSDVTEDRLNIFVDGTDTSGETKYWKWDFIETWEVILPVDSALVFYGGNEQFQVPRTYEQVETGPVQKDTCWLTVPSTHILIASTQEDISDHIYKFQLQSILPENDRLHVKYSIQVKQYALDRDMYNFWKDLKNANEDPGSIYERIPSQIFGNIKCCDGTVNALGYFYASAVSTKRIFINPGDVKIKTRSAYKGCTYVTDPNPRSIFYYFGHIVSTGQPVYTFVKDCSDCRIYGSDKKPDFWE